MTLTIDTNNKTILFSGCDMSGAIHFARLHEFDGYVVKKKLPATVIHGFVPVDFDVEKIQRENLGGEYLESEVVKNPHWADGKPYEEQVKEIEKNMFKYERVESESGEIGHRFVFDPFGLSKLSQTPEGYNRDNDTLELPGGKIVTRKQIEDGQI